MTLSNFIRDKREAILDEWEQFAEALAITKGMDKEALRDHARGILDAIVADMDQAQSPAQQKAKSRGGQPHTGPASQAEEHGFTRVTEGFTVNEAVAEFRALRASVLRLWAEASEDKGCGDEVTRFNEAIDQALTESLARFSDVRNRQTRLFDALLSNSPDLNYILDTKGRLVYANKAFAEALGKSPTELVGLNFFALCTSFSPGMEQKVQEVLASKTTLRDDITFSRDDGETIYYEYLLVPVINPEGHCEAVAGTARDITERKASEARIRRIANYDYLTDLPNRNLFRERLEREIKHAARSGLPLALLFIDLDGFKAVNDQFGHGAGDQLLQQVAARIQACVRDTDTVARLGGDEFTVILTAVTMPRQVDGVARKILASLGQPFSLKAGQACISGSIGITLYPDDATRIEELVRDADLAMYAAKKAGRNRYRFFAELSGKP